MESSMNNSIIGAIGKLALVPGRNHRSSRITNSGAFAGSNHKRRGLRRAARQTVSAASNDSLRDKWREESDRRNLEGAGLIFSVKVVEFEHTVTAVSTCYTDNQRPRLFAYIVKDYMTGNHFCMAFKTVKRSGVTGKRLQRVFGYAFDSCYVSPLLLSSEDVSSIEESTTTTTTTTELERCLQICSYSHRQPRGILRSNSNFSSVLEPERAYPLIQSPSHNILNDTTFDRKRNYNMGKISTTQDDVVRVCGTEIDAKSASNSRHTPRKHTKGRLSGQKVESIKVCQVKTAAVRTDYDAESLTKLCQSTVQDLNRDCYACCYHKKINQSQSDSFLQFKYHNHSREPFNPHPSNIYKEQAMSVETSPAKDVTLAADSKQLNDDLDMPSLGEVSLASVDEQKKKADTLQRKGSISSVISNDVIILLTSSSLHNEQTESTKYLSLQDSNDIPILTHEEQIMRQIAYLNLPTHDITTSSPRIPESNFNMVISKVCKDGDQNHMCGEIIDSRASFGFNSITELSQKLTQIASSMSNQLLCQQSVPHDQVETSQAIVLYPMNNVLGDLNFPGTNDCKSTVTETNKTATVAETNKTASDFAPCSITKLTKSNSTGTCNDVVSDDTASELVSSTSHLTLCSSTSLPHNHTEATSPCTTVTITHTSSSEATPPCTVTTYTSDATTSHTSSSEASPPCTVTTYTDRDATTTHTSSSQVDDGDAKNMIIVSTQNEMQNEPRIRGSLVINDECITHVTSPINVRTECNATRMTSSSYYDSATTHADGFNMNYSDRGSQVMIDGASFLCQSCSRNLSSAEAQRHISRMLTLVISPLQLAAAVSMEPAVTNGDDEKHTSTCLTATWE